MNIGGEVLRGAADDQFRLVFVAVGRLISSMNWMVHVTCIVHSYGGLVRHDVRCRTQCFVNQFAFGVCRSVKKQ